MVECGGCRAVVEVEFDPIDDPSLRGRITVLRDPITVDPGVALARSPKVRVPDDGLEILLVDDDHSFSTTLAALLHCEGFSVVARRTVSEATHHLATRRPDLLITDIRLDQDNGWDLAKHAMREYPTLSVIVVTGFSAERDDGEAEYWRVPIFLKPFDPVDLLAYIRTSIYTGS